MFPFDLEDEEIYPVIADDKEPADYEIDFTTGKLTGRIITDLEAIKQWARIVLTTERYYYPQYSWNHGNEFYNLIGKNYDENYIKSEAKRMTEEALMVKKEIIGIENFECEMKKNRLKVHFTINTTYGRGEIDV